MKFYLCVEGINLASFVYDTNDIKTIRGGGLGLLWEARTVALAALGLTPEQHEEMVLTQGASKVIWELEGDPVTVVAAVRKALSEDPLLIYATFAVEAVVVTDPPTDASFRNDIESLVAKVRWGQMNAPSFVAPAVSQDTPGPCGLDRQRPAASNRYDEAKKIYLSESTFQRSNRGLTARQHLYATALKDTSYDSVRFTDDLHALGRDERRGYLDAKMAVFYADGNSFGSGQVAYATDAEKQKEFDKVLRERNTLFLKSFLDATELDDGILVADNKSDRIRRVETLLWGGDEMLFIVPAWRGLQLADLFFRTMRGFQTPDGKSLSHGAGLVFCGIKTPIARVRKLAEALANLGKKVSDRKSPTLAFQALESFDHVGVDLHAYLAKRQPKAFSACPWVLDPQSLSAAIELSSIKNDLSHRKLHELASLMQGGHLDPKKEIDERIRKGVRDSDSNALEKGLKALVPFGEATQPDLASWFVLNELWDYIVDSPFDGAAAPADGGAAV